MITVVYHLLCQITIPLAHHFLSYGTSKPIGQFLSHPHCSHLLKALTQTHLLLIHTNLLLMRTHLLLMPHPPTPYSYPSAPYLYPPPLLHTHLLLIYIHLLLPHTHHTYMLSPLCTSYPLSPHSHHQFTPCICSSKHLHQSTTKLSEPPPTTHPPLVRLHHWNPILHVMLTSSHAKVNIFSWTKLFRTMARLRQYCLSRKSSQKHTRKPTLKWI